MNMTFLTAFVGRLLMPAVKPASLFFWMMIFWRLLERAAQSGKGYQTLINETLRGSLSPESAPLTVGTFRQILHEELRAAS